jgi:hypothetical protein
MDQLVGNVAVHGAMRTELCADLILTTKGTLEENAVLSLRPDRSEDDVASVVVFGIGRVGRRYVLVCPDVEEAADC